jgi:hypothetical protein
MYYNPGILQFLFKGFIGRITQFNSACNMLISMSIGSVAGRRLIAAASYYPSMVAYMKR